MRKNVFLFLLILVGVISFIKFLAFPTVAFRFGPGVYDFNKSITNDYELCRMSSNNVIIVPEDGWNNEIATIPSKVLRLNDYEDYIVAERQGLMRRSKDSLDAYEIPDKNVKDYWILDTENNWVLKNLTFSDFQKKLDSLKIPRNIELIDVTEY